MNCFNILIPHISYVLTTFSWRWPNPLQSGSLLATVVAVHTHFQPLLNRPSCGRHIASHAAQGVLWSSPSTMARKPGHDCSHSAARTPWRGCHMALVCQLHCLLTCNHKDPQPVITSPTLQVSKSLSQREIMHPKIKKTEKCHNISSWLAPFLSCGFKEWDRRRGWRFFQEFREIPSMGEGYQFLSADLATQQVHQSTQKHPPGQLETQLPSHWHGSPPYLKNWLQNSTELQISLAG